MVGSLIYITKRKSDGSLDVRARYDNSRFLEDLELCASVGAELEKFYKVGGEAETTVWRICQEYAASRLSEQELDTQINFVLHGS